MQVYIYISVHSFDLMDRYMHRYMHKFLSISPTLCLQSQQYH